MKKYFMILTSLFVFSLSATEINKEVEGVGATRAMAIDDALKEAVRQQFGLSLDSNSTSSLKIVETNDAIELSDGVQSGSNQTFKGKVKSYDIISQNCIDDKNCRVTLNVKFNIEDVKGDFKNRKSIAIESLEGLYHDDISLGLQQKFVQARKFAVVENKALEGLDYILTLNVTSSKTDKKRHDNSRTVALTGEYIEDIQVTYHSHIKVVYKVTKVATGQVVAQDTIKTTSSRNNLTYLRNLTVDKLFTAIHDHIYPLRIAKVTGKDVIIATGGDTLKSGDLYDVFAIGEEIVDPYTGESLGTKQIKVGVIKITETHPKYSEAIVVDNNHSNVAISDIIRKKKAIKKAVLKTIRPIASPEVQQVGIIL